MANLPVPYVLAANNGISTLAGAITNTATSVTLASGTGALFPNPNTSNNQFFVGTFIDAATGLIREIVKVTARSSDTLTIVRGQEGTTADNWNAGDLFQNLMTAGVQGDLQQPGQFSVLDTGVANSMVVTFYPAPASWTALEGIPFFVAVGSGNTNTSTSVVINANGLGNKTVLLAGGSAPPIGSIQAGAWLPMMYDGTEVQIMGLNVSPIVTLTTNLTLYCNFSSGSDSNNGLTSGTPFKTYQKGVDVAMSQYNTNGFTITVQGALGTTDTDGFVMTGNLIGGGVLRVIGDTSHANSPTCVISTTGPCITCEGGSNIFADGFQVQSSGDSAIFANTNGSVGLGQHFNYGSVSNAHRKAFQNGIISQQAGYQISGGGEYHDWSSGGQIIETSTIGAAINTLTGTPAFSGNFSYAYSMGRVFYSSGLISWDGGATGYYYQASGLSLIDTEGGGATYLPGSGANPSPTPNGGQYT